MSTEKIMEQAQVFASAWRVVGGTFDGGDALEVATQEKDELRRMVAELVEGRDALAAKLKDAEHDRDELRRVMNGFAKKMAELEGQEPVAWMGFGPRDGRPEFSISKPAGCVMRDFSMRPVFARPIPAESVNARLLEALKRAKDSLVAFKFVPGDANRWEESDEENLAAVYTCESGDSIATRKKYLCSREEMEAQKEKSK